MSGRLPGPHVAGLRLRTRLIKARNTAGLTQTQAAKRLGWSESTMGRYEKGTQRIQTDPLEEMMRVYRIVDSTEREELVALGRASREVGISTRYEKSFPPEFLLYIDYEIMADRIKMFETKFIPGPIQNGGYANGVVEALLPRVDPRHVYDIVDARNLRAAYLTSAKAPPIEFIIDEGALHHAVGAQDLSWGHKYDTMIRLFAHLKSLNTVGTAKQGGRVDESVNRDISIRIVPFECGLYEAFEGPFAILEFDQDEDPTLVYLENPSSVDLLDASDKRGAPLVEGYERKFERVKAGIPGPEDTAAILDYIADTFERRQKDLQSLLEHLKLTI